MTRLAALAAFLLGMLVQWLEPWDLLALWWRGRGKEKWVGVRSI